MLFIQRDHNRAALKKKDQIPRLNIQLLLFTYWLLIMKHCRHLLDSHRHCIIVLFRSAVSSSAGYKYCFNLLLTEASLCKVYERTCGCLHSQRRGTVGCGAVWMCQKSCTS